MKTPSVLIIIINILLKYTTNYNLNILKRVGPSY